MKNHPNWTRVRNSFGGWDYVHTPSGVRVYQYERKPFRPAEWGVQVSRVVPGSPVSHTLKSAKAFVERHYGDRVIKV